MFPTFALLNAAVFCHSMAAQWWVGAGLNLLGMAACLFFALAVERLEDGR